MQRPSLLPTLRIIERRDRKDTTGCQAIVQISDLFHLLGEVWSVFSTWVRSTEHGQIGMEGGFNKILRPQYL